MRRALAACTAAGLLVLAFTATASATPPEKVTFENEVTITMDGLCAFPVDITIDQVWHGINRYDADGNPLGFEFTVKGTDTFAATHTLVSEPYSYHLVGLDEDGEPIRIVSAGVIEKIRLPNGTMFVGAGWLDYLDKPADFLGLNPDRGSMGDIDALCDALG